MELIELYDCIGLQAEMVKKLNDAGKQIRLHLLEPYLEKLMDAATAKQAYEALQVLLEEDHDHSKMLYCQLECARRIFDRYKEKHISEAIYTDTMKCFPRFIEECRKKNGRMFFDRGWWTYRQISMSIFRIGELEYERKQREGEWVIGIHIPSDANLSKEAVDTSLRQAERFFQAYDKSWTDKKYTCNSWLLSPMLKKLLPEDSNILSFQKRFDIVQEDKEDKEYIEWLFQVPSDTKYKDLPVKTSLQKKARKLLLHGENIGSAYGIIKNPFCSSLSAPALMAAKPGNQSASCFAENTADSK